MLLNFTAKNYKSFADEMNFSMIAAPKQNDLKYSLFEIKTGEKDYKVQCSSVVYGANASGKSNIISAMDTFKSIILRGNIKNSEITSHNVAAAKLELIPNINNYDSTPVEFAIEFVDDSLLFKYILTVDLGLFPNKDYHKKILSEKLYLNNKLVFKRFNNVELGEYKHIGEYLLLKQNDMGKMSDIASESLSDDELFLTNGFKVIFSSALVKKFTDWIENNFIVIYRADSIIRARNFSNSDKEGLYVDSTASQVAKIFGSYSNKLGYLHRDENENAETLYSALDIHHGKGKTLIPAETFESYGTVRFVNLFPLVLQAFGNGATIVIDEFDASIHPSALMNIINMFHNDSINKNHAQLIFNTHNPIFLNSNLFRRDEIKFVQRDHDTGNSELYSLSDFGTSGKNGVRNSTDYMKYYLDYNYGAIEDIDFTPVFENIVNTSDTKNNGGE